MKCQMNSWVANWKGMCSSFFDILQGVSLPAASNFTWHLRLQYSMGILWWKAVEAPAVLSTVHGKVLKVVVLAGWNIMIHRPNELPTTSWSQDRTCNVQHVDLSKNLLERNEIWLRADVFLWYFDIFCQIYDFGSLAKLFKQMQDLWGSIGFCFEKNS